MKRRAVRRRGPLVIRMMQPQTMAAAREPEMKQIGTELDEMEEDNGEESSKRLDEFKQGNKSYDSGR